MPYATHETEFIGQKYYSDDMDLCHLLETMKIDAASQQGKTAEDAIYIVSHFPNVQDEVMVEGPDLIHQEPNAPSEKPNSSSSLSQEELYGCAYLRSIHSQLESQAYPTTGGEYLDAIFTHREILYSYPTAHQECARGFSDLAFLLERRAWRADREADSEAVSAFRHEAWVIASSLAPVPIKSKEPMFNGGQSVCVMMPMM